MQTEERGEPETLVSSIGYLALALMPLAQIIAVTTMAVISHSAGALAGLIVLRQMPGEILTL